MPSAVRWRSTPYLSGWHGQRSGCRVKIEAELLRIMLLLLLLPMLLMLRMLLRMLPMLLRIMLLMLRIMLLLLLMLLQGASRSTCNKLPN